MENKNMAEGSILYMDLEPWESTNTRQAEEKNNSRPIMMHPLLRTGTNLGEFNQCLLSNLWRQHQQLFEMSDSDIKNMKIMIENWRNKTY